MTRTVDEARELRRVAEASGRILAVTYNYSGYPMIRQARQMIERGALGRIRVVQGEYAQDWLSENLEESGHKQAAWRTDPAQSGAGGCIGDIGTHIYHLMAFVTGLEADAICADLATFVGQRKLDDNAHLLLRFTGGAKGMIWASQVAVGCDNGLQLRVFGEKGGVVWRQEHPNELMFAPLHDAPKRNHARRARGPARPRPGSRGFRPDIRKGTSKDSRISTARLPRRFARPGTAGSRMLLSCIQPQPMVKRAWRLSTPRYARARPARVRVEI